MGIQSRIVFCITFISIFMMAHPARANLWHTLFCGFDMSTRTLQIPAVSELDFDEIKKASPYLFEHLQADPKLALNDYFVEVQLRIPETRSTLDRLFVTRELQRRVLRNFNQVAIAEVGTDGDKIRIRLKKMDEVRYVIMHPLIKSVNRPGSAWLIGPAIIPKFQPAQSKFTDFENFKNSGFRDGKPRTDIVLSSFFLAQTSAKDAEALGQILSMNTSIKVKRLSRSNGALTFEVSGTPAAILEAADDPLVDVVSPRRLDAR